MVFIPIYPDRRPKCEELRNSRAMRCDAIRMDQPRTVFFREFSGHYGYPTIFIHNPLIKWEWF